MRRIAYIFAAIAAVAAVGCQKFEKETASVKRTITVSFDGTKTNIENGHTVWVGNESIRLINASTAKTYTVGKDGVEIKDGKLVIPTDMAAPVYAVYPASAAISEKVTNDIVEFTTEGQDGSFAKANICVAKENNGTLSFNNATAIVNIKNAVTAKTNYYNLSSSDGHIFGTMTADFSSGLVITAPSSGDSAFTEGTRYTNGQTKDVPNKFETVSGLTNDYFFGYSCQ